MLALTGGAEVQDFLSRHPRHQLLRNNQGQQRVVRNGYLPGFDHPAPDLLPRIASLHVHLPPALDDACYNLLRLAQAG